MTSVRRLEIVSSIGLYTEQFASILASQVTSKLILMPLNNSTTDPRSKSGKAGQEEMCLSLWMFSPSIHFSFSGMTEDSNVVPEGNQRTHIEGQHAMKAFFQTPTAKEAGHLSEKQDVEEVFLPIESIVEIRESLQKSSKILPKSARKFGLWDVGLLSRF